MHKSSYIPPASCQKTRAFCCFFLSQLSLIPSHLFPLVARERKLASTCVDYASSTFFFSQKQYLCVNIPNRYLIPAVLLAPCVRGAFLSQLSLYSGSNLFFSTWQAEQKKIGKGDECICCTVFPDIWGRGGGTAGSLFHAVPTCYTTLGSVGI